MLNTFINIYGETLLWNTPFLCGLALGIYGLTNAAFQIPYGSLSDRTGRKPVILWGLAMLSVGLFIGYLANNIYLSFHGHCRAAGPFRALPTPGSTTVWKMTKRAEL